MRLSARIKGLERAVHARRAPCAVCNGAGRAVFSEPLRTGQDRGAPCPSCGRAINVRFVDMIAQRGCVAAPRLLREDSPCV